MLIYLFLLLGLYLIHPSMDRVLWPEVASYQVPDNHYLLFTTIMSSHLRDDDGTDPRETSGINNMGIWLPSGATGDREGKPPFLISNG
jgi:hypothetical protein